MGCERCEQYRYSCSTGNAERMGVNLPTGSFTDRSGAERAQSAKSHMGQPFFPGAERNGAETRLRPTRKRNVGAPRRRAAQRKAAERRERTVGWAGYSRAVPQSGGACGDGLRDCGTAKHNTGLPAKRALTGQGGAAERLSFRHGCDGSEWMWSL